MRSENRIPAPWEVFARKVADVVPLLKCRASARPQTSPTETGKCFALTAISCRSSSANVACTAGSADAVHKSNSGIQPPKSCGFPSPKIRCWMVGKFACTREVTSHDPPLSPARWVAACNDNMYKNEIASQKRAAYLQQAARPFCHRRRIPRVQRIQHARAKDRR